MFALPFGRPTNGNQRALQIADAQSALLRSDFLLERLRCQTAYFSASSDIRIGFDDGACPGEEQNGMAKSPDMTSLSLFARNVLTYRRQPRAPASLSAVKPRLLDLFCCAGGASVGYAQAGFDVTGVDVKAQPNYPFPFIQADALALDPDFLASFDAVHASPPCQAYSDLAKRNRNGHEWPRLIEPVREMLVRSGLPYIIENVDGAPLLDPVVLCGTMFPELRVLRHRLFEANFEIAPPPHKKHPKVHTFDRRKSHFGKTNEWRDFVQVTGGGNCTLAAARQAMGIDWMTKTEINESIPPAYTKFVGRELLRQFSLHDAAQEKLRKNA